jgi:hypothetical protein
MKKFTQNDVIVNTIKVYPKIRFFVHSGSISYNDTKNTGVLLNDFLYIEPSQIPDGAIFTETDDALLTEDSDFLINE